MGGVRGLDVDQHWDFGLKLAKTEFFSPDFGAHRQRWDLLGWGCYVCRPTNLLVLATKYGCVPETEVGLSGMGLLRACVAGPRIC